MNALSPSQAVRRVLVIEDDADVRDLLTLCVDSLVEGAAADRAENGLVALRRLQDDGPWDLVLCDIMMPGLDGARLLRDLHTRGTLAGHRVLVLTAVPRDQIGDLLDLPGVVGYLQKPVDPMTLAARVQDLLRAT